MSSVVRIIKSRRKTKNLLTVIYRETYVNIQVDKRFIFYIQWVLMLLLKLNQNNVGKVNEQQYQMAYIWFLTWRVFINHYCCPRIMLQQPHGEKIWWISKCLKRIINALHNTKVIKSTTTKTIILQSSALCCTCKDFCYCCSDDSFFNLIFYLEFFSMHTNEAVVHSSVAWLEPQEVQLLRRLIIDGKSTWNAKIKESKKEKAVIPGWFNDLATMLYPHIDLLILFHVVYTEKFFSSHMKGNHISKLFLYFTERKTYAKCEMCLFLHVFFYFQFLLESSVIP